MDIPSNMPFSQLPVDWYAPFLRTRGLTYRHEMSPKTREVDFRALLAAVDRAWQWAGYEDELPGLRQLRHRVAGKHKCGYGRSSS